MAATSITLTLAWEREDGSGEPCYDCGDACWLTQHRMFVVGPEGGLPVWIDGEEVILCGACYDE